MLAQENITNPALPRLQEKTGIEFFQQLIPSLITLGLIIGVLFFLFNMVAGAIQWISSSGDKTAIETARSRITNALVGVIILFAVFAVVGVIEVLFDTDILTIDIAPLKIE